MKYTPLAVDVNLKPEGFVVDVNSLYAHLATLHDQRDARGLRYALVTVLVFIVLAKLAGENHLRGIADWVKHRKESLAQALGLAKAQAPHASTYSRVLGHAVNVAEFERVVSQFFASQPQAGQSVVITIDGKTPEVMAIINNLVLGLLLRKESGMCQRPGDDSLPIQTRF